MNDDQPTRILLIDDNPQDATVIREILTQSQTASFGVDWVDNLLLALQRLTDNNVDLVLLDISLPGKQKLENLTHLLAQTAHIPIIVLTHINDEKLAEQSIRAGAQDYLVKDRVLIIGNNSLVRSIRYTLSRKQATETKIHYRNLFKGVPIGLYRTTTSGRFVDANPALVRMLDYPDCESLLSVNAADLYASPQDRQQWQEQLTHLGTVRDFVVQLRRHDGTMIWMEDNARTVQDASGQVLYYEGSLVDVTERKQAEEALKHRVEQLAALSRVSQVITASLDLDQVLTEIVSVASEVTSSDYTSVILLDKQGKLIQSAQNLPDIKHLDSDETLTNWVIHSRRPAIIEIDENGNISPKLGDRALHTVDQLTTKAGIKSIAALPLVVKERLLGVLYLYSLQSSTFYDQLPLLNTFANQVAIAIENARLYEQTQKELAERQRAEEQARRHAEQMIIVHTISQAITSNLERSQVLETVLGGIKHVLDVGACSLLRYDRERNDLVFEAASGLAAEAVLDMRLEIGQGVAGWVALTGQPLLVPDVRQDPRFYAGVDQETGLTTRSLIAVPIEIGGERVGVIEAMSVGDQILKEQDMDLLQILSNSVAVAIQNAQLFAQVRQYSNRLEKLVAARTIELQQAKDRVEAILHNVGDPIVLTDIDGNLLNVNPAFEEQTGHASQNIADLSLHDLFELQPAPNNEASSAKNFQGFISEIQDLTAEQKRWRGELVGRRKDGSAYDADVIVGATRDQNGQVAGFVSSIRDISKLKEVDRLKDQFVSDASHELRTPLTNIKLYHHLLQQSNPHERQRYLNILAHEQTRLEHLVDNLFDLSRLDLGTVQANRVPLNVGALVQSLTQDRKILATVKGLKLDTELCDALPLTLADARMLTQVLDNLITNAFLYTPAPGQVTVRTNQRRQHGQDWVTISVSDTGLGILAEEQEEIFKRFYRGTIAQQTGIQGTGLGLAICREIVERHRGHIQLESKPNVGSTFTVFLPAIAAHQETQAIGAVAQKSQQIASQVQALTSKDILAIPDMPPTLWSGPRLLLVEDDAYLLAGLYEALTSAGYQVWTAKDGQQGLEKLDDVQPDLIISDVMMPRMDGFEFCRAVRARPDSVVVPFIFLTAKGHKQARHLGLALGAEDYVVKPFELEDLLHLVSVRLQRKAKIQANQQAEIGALKRRISNTFTHEFRTPLTYITTYASMLTDGIAEMDAPQVRRMLSGIQHGSERLRQLVLDFLLLIDLETGIAANNYRLDHGYLTQPKEWISQIVERYRTQAQAADLALHLDLADDLPTITASGAYLSDALGRLLDNAIKFSNPNSAHITVRAETVGSELCISIKDEGIGIPTSHLEKIFTPFYQVNREKREQSGIGVGLAIAKGLINLHGGRIKVSSQAAIGSTFSIWLPATNYQ